MIHFWENTFWVKHHFLCICQSQYLEVQSQCTLRFSGMPIPMVQVSNLYYPFLRKCILGYNITFLCIWRVKVSAPWGFQACWLQWCKYQSCMMIHFWEITFWAITSLSFVFRGSSQCTLRFSGMPIPMVQVSKLYDDPFLRKHILGYKIKVFPLYFKTEDQTHFGLPWGFQACCIWYRFQSCIIHFWENAFWAITSLSFVFGGSKSVHPEVFRHADCSGASIKAVWWSISEKTHFGL